METCKTCSKTAERATARNVKEGMLWNDDDQCWICQNCDRIRINRQFVGADP